MRIAGYALTLPFVGRHAMILLLLSCTLIPFQATIIPAYLITAQLGLLNSYLGLALPLLSTIVCIFVFKSSFEAVPRSLIDAARIDGLGDLRILLRVMLPLSKPAIATNVMLSFIWSWNNFLWPLIITRTPTCRPCRSVWRASCPTWRTRPARSTPSSSWCWRPGCWSS